MDFDGRTAWITGASSGIGRALALELARRGCALLLSGRRTDELRALAARVDVPSLVLPFEATDLAALPGIVAEAEGWRGRIDLLVNNAGVSQRSLALDTDFDVYRTIMEIDFFAAVRLTQLVLPPMVARRSGHLAVVSSVAGKVGVPLRTGYYAAKHAVVGYFDALRAEIETAYRVGVSVITPGSISTDVARNALSGDGSRSMMIDPVIERGIAVDDAARTIIDGILDGKREIPVARGEELAILGLRATDPEAAFAALAASGRVLAERRTLRA